MRHVYQRKTINRYLTRKPKLEASKDLQKIMYGLTKTTEKRFTKILNKWLEKYYDFLEEKLVSYNGK